MAEKQRTIAREASFSGIGLHTGNLTTLTFKPAPPNSGVTFFRVDLPDHPAVKADIDHVVDVSRGTTIGVNGVRVHTVEHVLSAVAGLGIDNVNIEVDANETPVGDGSALPFLRALKRAGIAEQDAEREYIRITQPVYYKSDDVTLSVLPADELRLTMTIAYDHVAVGTQYASMVLAPDVFEREIAPARTYCFLREVRMLQEQGLIKGGSPENAVVIGDDAILNDDLRFPDEFVRHKIMDLIGDTFLLGKPMKGHIIAVKSGHATHAMFTRQIKHSLMNGNRARPSAMVQDERRHAPALDVNMIMKVLPHRYPFLLVDRILELEPLKRVVGIKNVTFNEPFFQGHWPSMPVMPGVLIIEAMAQVSSVLIFTDENGDYAGKLAFFMGIDRVKFRRTVVPGDQLVVEAHMLKFRRNACRAKAVARIDGQIAAEAEMLFGLVDAHDDIAAETRHAAF